MLNSIAKNQEENTRGAVAIIEYDVMIIHTRDTSGLGRGRRMLPSREALDESATQRQPPSPWTSRSYAISSDGVIQSHEYNHDTKDNTHDDSTKEKPLSALVLF